MKAKYTPGKWEISQGGRLPILLFVKDGRWKNSDTYIAHIGGGLNDPGDFSETFANARLIVAAPELLLAAQQALFALVDDENGRDELLNETERNAVQMLRAAIKKAEG